jgi:hypothetical protein
MAPNHGTTTPHRGGGRGQSEHTSASLSLAASKAASYNATTQSMLGTITTYLTELHTRLTPQEDIHNLLNPS